MIYFRTEAPMSDYFDFTSEVTQSASTICQQNHFNQETDTQELWLDGVVITQHGVVAAYSKDGFSLLRFVHNGWLYGRRWNEKFGRVKLVQLAEDFTQEIVNS